MRKNALTRQIRHAYRQDKLAQVLTLPEFKFGKAFGMETVRVSDRSEDRGWGPPADYYHFKDNGSRVLATAHLDTVVAPARRAASTRFAGTKRGPLVVSGALDDRLGAYAITNLLPAMGISCDWLFTIGEESGQSTAEHFKPPKDYDHVIEFDRGGKDVVMYQYEDRATTELVEACSAPVGQGSFSDIAYLEHLGVKAFNWGIGYGGNYHSEKGYAYLDDTFAMVAKYLVFHDQNKGVTLEHTAGYGYGSYVKDDVSDCCWCGERGTVSTTTGYCEYCGSCADCGETDPYVAAGWNDPDVDVCTCYLPSRNRREQEQDDAPFTDWRTAGYTTTGMTWADYQAMRPGSLIAPAEASN